MEAQVLARKWRPRVFADLIGQEHTTRILTNALRLKRGHHAYLFCGTRGVGKTTVARILAKSFFCENRTDVEPCNNCLSCQAIDKGNYADLIEVDAASRTKVEDTRELLGDIQFAPLKGIYKIYLIDEVHMLSNHSFNALLKSLEEPPPHIIFLFATTEPQKLPMTIVSRCLKFNLKPIMESVIVPRLEKILAAEGIDYDEDSVRLLAHYARGSMRDALSLADQAIAYCEKKLNAKKVATMLGTGSMLAMEEVLDSLINGRAEELLKATQRMEESGADFEEFLNKLMESLQDISVLQLTQQPTEMKTNPLRDYISQLSAEELQLFYQIALLAKKELAWAPSPRRAVDMALLRMLSMQPLVAAMTQVAARSPIPTERESIKRERQEATHEVKEEDVKEEGEVETAQAAVQETAMEKTPTAVESKETAMEKTPTAVESKGTPEFVKSLKEKAVVAPAIAEMEEVKEAGKTQEAGETARAAKRDGREKGARS